MPGRVFVLSAPSGTGKTTIVQGVCRLVPGLEVSISLTTRRRRTEERAGVDYRFVSRKEFDRLRKQGRFVEWAEVFGNYYGTDRSLLESRLGQGKSVLLTIDVQGGLQIRESFPTAFLIGLLPPSLKEQERRLRIRGGLTEAEIRLRLDGARRERKVLMEQYDVRLINRNLPGTIRKLRRIIARQVPVPGR